MSNLKNKLNKTAEIDIQDGDKALEELLHATKDASDILYNAYEKHSSISEQMLKQLDESTEIIDDIYDIINNLIDIKKEIQRITKKINY